MIEDTRLKGINQLIHRFLCNEAKRNKIEYHEENTNRYRCRSSSFHSTIFFLNHTSFDPIAKSYLVNEMRSANPREYRNAKKKWKQKPEDSQHSRKVE